MNAAFTGWVEVPPRGFRWEKVGKQYLLREMGELHEGTWYAPHSSDDHDALFYEFSGIDPTRDDVLEFAGDYGALEGDGESLDMWQSQISAMGKAIKFWKSSRGVNEDFGGPPKVDQLRGDAWLDDAVLEIRDTFPNPKHTFKSEGRGTPLRQALTYAGLMLEGCRFEFRPGYRDMKGRSQRAKIYRPSLWLVTTNLREALWAQYIDAVLNKHEIDNCELCNRPMRAKKRRMFCSRACRVNSYLGRKEEVQKLYRSGLTVKQIMKKLKLDDEETVEGWCHE